MWGLAVPRKEHEQGPNSIKVVEKENQGGFVYKDEFWANGVSPVGCSMAVDILKKALKSCAIQDVSVKMIKGE